MIFAAATDEGTLFVFPSLEDAIAYCEGIDVEDGGWLFWNENGSALVADFVVPNHRGRHTICSGAYQLVPASSLPSLEEVLARILQMDRNPYFTDLSDVRVHLASASQASFQS